MKLPGGGKVPKEFAEFLAGKIMECLGDLKSKEETGQHLWDEFQIKPEYTIKLWDMVEKENPDYFIPYKTELEKYRKSREQQVTAPPASSTNAEIGSSSKPVEVDSTKAKEIAKTIHFPGGCNNTREFAQSRFEECISVYKNKEETVNHLSDEFQIRPEITTAMWDHFERDDPDFFSKCKTECEIEKENPGFFSNRRILVPKSNTELGKRTRPEGNEQEQQQQQRQFPPAHRLTESARPHASSQVPQQAATSSSEVQARMKQRTQNLQASQPPEGVELWKQILSTVTRIAATSEQMLKLMIDAKSGDKQPVGQEQVRGDIELAENLQSQSQQLPRETQRKDIPGNEASEDSNNK